jgi:hypothetical protein
MLPLPPAMRSNLAFGLVAVSWGGSYVASKIGLADAGPFSFALLTTLGGRPYRSR